MANDAPATPPELGLSARLRRQWRLRPERNLQILIAIVAGLLFASPVLAVLVSAFRTSPFTDGPRAGVWTPEPFLNVMSDPGTWETLGNTVLLTVASVIPGIILAIFFATIVSRTNAIAKWLVTALMAIMVAVPPLFYALTWSMLAAPRSGLLNVWLRGIGACFDPQFDNVCFADGYQWVGEGPIFIESWGGLILVSTFRGMAFMYLILIGPFSSMDRTLEEAARVSGAGPVRTFFGTQIPVLLPAITAVLIISTVASLEAFDVPVVLGIPADIYVLPTEVFRYLNDSRYPFYGEASSVSIVLLVILILLLVLERSLHGRRRFTTISGKGARQSEWALGAWRIPVFIFTLLYAIVAVGLPLAQLLLVAFAPYFGWTPTGIEHLFDPQAGLTLKWFDQLLSNPQYVNSFVSTAGVAALAAALAVIAVIVILWSARLRRGRLGALLDSGQMLPMVVPGLLLALGIITVVLLFEPLKGLYGTPVLLMIALFIAVVPLASRSIAGAMAQIPAELEEATRVAGGNRARALVGVVFRLVLPSALNGWLLCFVVASGTLAIPMLLGERRSPMLAIRVYDDFLAGNFSLAAASFVLFIVEILLVVLVVEALRRLLGRRRGRVETPSANADPEWTGAVTTSPRRGRSTPSRTPRD